MEVDFLCHQDSLRKLPSTLRAPGDVLSSSVNILCSWETFHLLLLIFYAAGIPSITFYQLSVQPGDFRHIQSTFPVVGRPSVNFHQLSDPPEDLPSTSMNIPCHRVT